MLKWHCPHCGSAFLSIPLNGCQHCGKFALDTLNIEVEAIEIPLAGTYRTMGTRPGRQTITLKVAGSISGQWPQLRSGRPMPFIYDAWI